MKRILIAVHTYTFFGELHRVAVTLRQSGYYEPVLFFPHFYPTIARDTGQCLSEGLACLDHRGRPMEHNTAIEMHTFIKNRQVATRMQKMLGRLKLLGLVKKILALTDLNQRNFDNFFFELLYLRNRVAFVRKILTRGKFDLLVLGGDLVHYDTACCIRAAKSLGIPSIIVPCTMSNALEMAESYFPVRKYHLDRFPNGLVGRLFPEWVYRHKGRPLLRLPAGQALAMKVLGLAPPHPWINLSGFADVIAAESSRMVRYYTREGIPRQQLEVTGTISDDALAASLRQADERRQALYRRYGLAGNRPMLLTALPPDQLYMVGGRPDCDFQTYSQLVEYWLSTLARAADHEIIVNLHPSLPYEHWKDRSRPGVTIVKENITELIPLCRMFVASISTVIRWAIACGKPVLNYDVYRFHYTDYVGVPGVLTVEKRTDFESTLRRLTADQAYYDQVAAAQRRQAPEWGNLDGQAAKRMMALFGRLTNRRKNVV